MQVAFAKQNGLLPTRILLALIKRNLGYDVQSHIFSSSLIYLNYGLKQLPRIDIVVSLRLCDFFSYFITRINIFYGELSSFWPLAVTRRDSSDSIPSPKLKHSAGRSCSHCCRSPPSVSSLVFFFFCIFVRSPFL